MEPPVFKNYVAWYGEEDSPQNDEIHIRRWLMEKFPYEITVEDGSSVDLRDIGDNTLGPWSAYGGRWGLQHMDYYFFELEIDAMAFKLKFL